MRRLNGIILGLTLAVGCGPVERVRERLFDGPTPRDRYAQMLEWAGLENTALARDWREAGERALREAVVVRSPHAEESWLAPDQAGALGYRLSARRGQRLTISIDLPTDSAALLFLDAFRVTDDSLAPYRREASADSAARVLEFEPRRDGDYIVRVQPELLRGGRLSIRIGLDPTLAFPVEGRGWNDIGSRFGAPRDGGARDHHGVDIFAPRGTPALAATAARVTRVEVTPIGGKVVWLRDERRGQTLYYAHLDSQMERAMTATAPGDLLLVVSGFGMERTPLAKRLLARALGERDITGSHEAAPDGFLIAYGTNVAPGEYRRGSIVDLAPTVLYYMGVPIGRDMDGFARTDLFQITFTHEHPVRYTLTHER